MKKIQTVSLGLAVLLGLSTLSALAQETQTGWTSEENWVTRLPQEQIKKMLGAPTPETPDADFTLHESPAMGALNSARALPDLLDWRNTQGANWVSPVLNQGNCGSCVAFATVATLETQINVSSGIPGFNPKLSTQALFACGGGKCDEGWTVPEANRFLKSTGIPDEACAPYTMGSTGKDEACNAICPDASRRSFRILGYKNPTRGFKSIETLKAALQLGPLVTNMTVYDDFVGYKSGVYKRVSNERLGGHAVSIVGYDSKKRAWIVKNSWGDDWGDQGYILISWDDTSGVGSSTTWYELPQADGYALLKSPKGRPYVAGALEFRAESTFKDTQSLDIEIFNPSGKSVLSLPCAQGNTRGAACAARLDTHKLADGRYQAAAVVTRSLASRPAHSFYEDFYVLNGKPSLHLDFKPKGFDPSKPVSGRVEFHLVSNTLPVPLSSVQFHVEDLSGKERYSRLQDQVVPKMTLGWRTTALPNGSYRVWFSGEIKTNTQVFKTQTPKLELEVNN